MAWLPRSLRRKRTPESADAALRAALIAVLGRDLERAESLLVDAVRRDPNAVDAYLALGRLYRMRGEIGRAIRIDQNLLLRRDLSREQTLAALEDLAEDFRQGGFLQRAIASYEEVLTRDVRHRGALSALVSLLASVRDFPRAIELSRRLTRLRRPGQTDTCPDETELRVQSALTAQAEGRSADARRALKRALRRDPRKVFAWILLGEIEAERGRSKAALAAWARVPALDRRSGPQVYGRLEATYAALDRAREFEAYLAGLIAERPDDPHAREALARALAARGETEEAIAELRRLLARDPDDLGGRGALGRLILAEQRDPEAVKEYAELLDVLERQGLLRRREDLS
jgi:lipopolysaccharide biosynthesis regulator YciM